MTDTLDNTLKTWADGHGATEEHLTSLTTRITTEATRAQYQAAETSTPILHRFGYAALGMAATLLIGILCLHSGILGYSRDDTGQCLARISSDDANAIRSLYAETDHMFAEKLRWIAESNGNMGIGVESVLGGQANDSVPLLVRLTVVSRAAGESEWKREWNADVLLRGQEVAEIAPNPNTPNKLTLWAYPLEDGRVAIDTGFSLVAPVELASHSSAVASEGAPLELLSMKTGDVEYRVFQTVQSLKQKTTG